jgi:hypothetical protein
MSAASTIAAPAATTPSVATPPTMPGPKTELGYQFLACAEDVVKEVSPSSGRRLAKEAARQCRRQVTAK